MIKSAIFDLGGVYFIDGTKISIETISKRYGIRYEDVYGLLTTGSELGNSYRKGEITSEYFWSKFKEQLGIETENEDLNELWIKNYAIIKGTVEMIKKLKIKGIKLYYLSDNVKDRNEFLEKKYHFLRDFADGVFSYKVHRTKNDGAFVFKLALEKTGEKPENVLYIDDKEKFVKTAISLGMKGICFKNPKQLEIELKKFGL